MKKRNLIVMFAVVLVAILAVPFAYAGHGFGRHHGASDMGILGGHFDRIKKALDLSDAQVEQLKAIHDDLKTQNQALHQQIHGSRAAIAQTLLNNPNDLAAAQAQIDRDLAVERTISLNKLNAASKALNVLTPDQRTKIAQFLAKRQARHQQQK